MSDKSKIKSFNFLVQRYEKELEELKNNLEIKEDKKIQATCILREVINDMKFILEKQNDK